MTKKSLLFEPVRYFGILYKCDETIHAPLSHGYSDKSNRIYSTKFKEYIKKMGRVLGIFMSGWMLDLVFMKY